MQRRRDRVTELAAALEDWKGRIFRPEYRTSSPVKPQFCMQALREELPRDAIVVGGAGNPGIWTHLVEIYEPRTYVTPGFQGTLGFGFPTAIGVKAAVPDKAVVSVTGDGGFMFGMP